MSYAESDPTELTFAQLVCEVERRWKEVHEGRCAYCHAPLKDHTCKYKKQESEYYNENYLGTLPRPGEAAPPPITTEQLMARSGEFINIAAHLRSVLETCGVKTPPEVNSMQLMELAKQFLEERKTAAARPEAADNFFLSEVGVVDVRMLWKHWTALQEAEKQLGLVGNEEPTVRLQQLLARVAPYGKPEPHPEAVEIPAEMTGLDGKTESGVMRLIPGPDGKTIHAWKPDATREHVNDGAWPLAQPVRTGRFSSEKPNQANTPTSSGASPQEIRREREARYGNPIINHRAACYALTGLLENHYQIKLPHPVPAHIAALFQICTKVTREAYRHTPDNAVDVHNYIDIAAECKDENPNNKEAARG